MITLYTYPARGTQVSFSPFCVKAAWLLNLSGVPWQREDMFDPRKMPHGKLPAISVEGRFIDDSDNIRTFLEAQGHDFDADLSPRDKSTARAFIRMAEEHLYWHLILDRWADDANWAIMQRDSFGGIPRILRRPVTNKIRRDLLGALKGTGLGRFSVSERLDRIELDLQAIATRLEGSEFLFADRPTGADTSVGAMLAAMIDAPAPTALSRRLAQDDLLRAYAARCTDAMG